MSAYDLKLEDNAVKNIDAVYHHQLYTPSVLFFDHTAFGFVFLIYLYFTENNISILISLSGFCCVLEYAINCFVILIKNMHNIQMVYANYYSFFT